MSLGDYHRLGWDDPHITGDYEIETCPRDVNGRTCREPLNDDGSCSSCETVACECGAVVPAAEMAPIGDDGNACAACRAVAS